MRWASSAWASATKALSEPVVLAKKASDSGTVCDQRKGFFGLSFTATLHRLFSLGIPLPQCQVAIRIGQLRLAAAVIEPGVPGQRGRHLSACWHVAEPLVEHGLRGGADRPIGLRINGGCEQVD